QVDGAVPHVRSETRMGDRGVPEIPANADETKGADQMNLSEFRDWLKTVIDSPQWYLNSMAEKVDRCITLYNTTGAPGRIAVGGLQATGYMIKPVSILDQWGKNASTAEVKAQEVYD